MMPGKLAEKEAEAVEPSKPIAEYDSTDDRRSTVAAQYKANLAERKSNPDRILYDGEDLINLDEGESPDSCPEDC